MTKYAVISRRRGDQFEEIYDTEAEALKSADLNWMHLLKRERANCSDFFVCEYDEDADESIGRVIFDIKEWDAEQYKCKTPNGEWDIAECARLCDDAGLAEEWDDAGEDFEAVVQRAADIMGVDIWSGK